MNAQMPNSRFAIAMIGLALVLSTAWVGIVRLWSHLQEGNLGDWAIVLLLILGPAVVGACWWNEVTIRRNAIAFLNTKIQKLEADLSAARTRREQGEADEDKGTLAMASTLPPLLRSGSYKVVYDD